MIVVRTDQTLRAVIEAVARRDGLTISQFTRAALADAAVRAIRICEERERDEQES
jgi:hypothetical protein